MSSSTVRVVLVVENGAANDENHHQQLGTEPEQGRPSPKITGATWYHGSCEELECQNLLINTPSKNN